MMPMMDNRHMWQGKLTIGEPMLKHTSWRVGGTADRYYEPAGLEDLAVFVAEEISEDESLHFVGLGSNLLVRDGGIRGTVICTSGLLKELNKTGESTIRVEAGVASAKAARFAVENGLSGAEFLAGIPGTVGGALAMNAGAFGGEIWEIVEKVETLDREGKIHERLPSEYEVGYRSVTGPTGEWFVAAHFCLDSGDIKEGKAQIKSLLSKRGSSQPTQMPNAGSVFKNPEGDFAARLIESCGLKGYCIGKACVSDMHANFIVNTGGARAEDIEALIGHMQETVSSRMGILLEPEVRIIGERL